MININTYIIEKLHLNKDIDIDHTSFDKNDKYYCEVSILEWHNHKWTDLSIHIYDIDNDVLEHLSKLKINEYGFYEETNDNSSFKSTSIYLKINDCLDFLNDICLDLSNKQKITEKYFNKKVKISNIQFDTDTNPGQIIDYINYQKEKYNL